MIIAINTTTTMVNTVELFRQKFINPPGGRGIPYDIIGSPNVVRWGACDEGADGGWCDMWFAYASTLPRVYMDGDIWVKSIVYFFPRHWVKN